MSLPYALAAVLDCSYLFISTLHLAPYDKLPFHYLSLLTLNPTPHFSLVAIHSIAWSVCMYPYISKPQSNAQGTLVEFTLVLPWLTRLSHWWYQCAQLSLSPYTLLLTLIWSSHQQSSLSWLHQHSSSLSVQVTKGHSIYGILLCAQTN